VGLFYTTPEPTRGVTSEHAELALSLSWLLLQFVVHYEQLIQ